jgi:hypothetical protein
MKTKLHKRKAHRLKSVLPIPLPLPNGAAWGEKCGLVLNAGEFSAGCGKSGISSF